MESAAEMMRRLGGPSPKVVVAKSSLPDPPVGRFDDFEPNLKPHPKSGKVESAQSGKVDLPSDLPKWRSPSERVLGLGERYTLMPTMFRTLDEATRGGLRDRRRLFITGAPGSNKTGLALFMAINYLMTGCAVAIFATDEDADSLSIRIGQMLGYEREALESPDHCDHERSKKELAEKLAKYPLILVDGDENEDASIDDVAEALIQLANGRPSVLVVDSIQRARTATTDGAIDNKTRADDVVKALKRASAKGPLVIATSEANRGHYANQRNRNEGLASSKESGSIEYQASVLVVLSSVKGESDLVDAEICKNRLGTKTAFRIELDRTTSTYKEVDAPDIDEDARRADDFRKRIDKAKAEALAYVVAHPGKSKRAIADAIKGNNQIKSDAIAELLTSNQLRTEDGRNGGHTYYSSFQ